jgi:hypothetical protein
LIEQTLNKNISISPKEDLKPTQKDIIEANNRVTQQDFKSFRQALHDYYMAGGKIVLEWDNGKKVIL